MNGWIDGAIDGSIDGSIDRWIDASIDGSIDGYNDRWIDGWIDRWIYRWLSRGEVIGDIQFFFDRCESFKIFKQFELFDHRIIQKSFGLFESFEYSKNVSHEIFCFILKNIS